MLTYLSRVSSRICRELALIIVPMGSPSCGGDVTVYVWHKPTELAHSFLFCSCVYFCLYGHFNFISFHEFSRQLSVFSLCPCGLSSGFWSFQLYISLWKHPRPIFNMEWHTTSWHELWIGEFYLWFDDLFVQPDATFMADWVLFIKNRSIHVMMINEMWYSRAGQRVVLHTLLGRTRPSGLGHWH